MSDRNRILQGVNDSPQRFQVRTSAFLAAFAEHWPRSNRMGDAECHIFQCADLIEVWLDTLGTACRTRPVFVGVYDATNRPVLLLALGIGRCIGIRTLTFLDGTVADYNQPVLFPAARFLDATSWAEIWPAIVQALPPFDAAIFEKVPEIIGDLPNPLMHLGTFRRSGSGHVMSLTGSRLGLETRLPYRKVRSRQMRRLSELDSLAFKVAGTGVEADALLQTLLAMKTRQFAKTQVPGFELAGKREFYVAVTQRLLSAGTVHVSGLTVGTTTVAAHWGLVLQGRFYLLLTAYDEDWKRFSPGSLSHEALIRWCHARGMIWFDFGIGDEAYKADYCETLVSLSRLELPLSPVGRAYLAVLQLQVRLRATRAWQRLRPLKWHFLHTVRALWNKLKVGP